jgi:hypothetical protein
MNHRFLREPYLLVTLTLFSCSSLSLQGVDYAWPVESVLTVDENNVIEDERYSMSFRVTDLAMEESEDSTALKGRTLRVIRNGQGYYFMTGPGFKNVYVFAAGAGELNLKSRIYVSETGLNAPAMNQRTPYIELIDDNTARRLLTSDGIEEEKR